MGNRVTLAVLLLAVLAGCGDAAVTPAGQPPDASDAPGARSPAGTPAEDAAAIPFGLDVSNQSFAVPQVRIVVSIDGEVVVDEVFDVGNQHTWKRFDLRLSPGQHVVRAEAPEHGESMEFALELREERWATLSYWAAQEPGSTFTWNEHDQPPAYA